MVDTFTVHVEEEVLNDLQARLARTRWPEEVEDAQWEYGTSRSYLRALVEHWRTTFNWRAQERRINALSQFRTRVHDLDIHFVHVRGKGPQPTPLLLSHGWPSTFWEMQSIIGPLTDPAAHGGNPADAFDVIIPSLPGFCFSQLAPRRGWIRVEDYWRTLMTEVLGYRRFIAHGCDIGARVTSQLGRYHGDVVAGIHIGSVDLEWPSPLPSDLDASERDYVARVAAWDKSEGGYAHIQGTRPQTLAYGLNDSPVGLASWMVEKFRAWSDCGGNIESRFSMDELLTHITLYWVTETINTSMRRYFEAENNPEPNPLPLGARIETPTAVAMFPGEKDLVVPRQFAERCYNIVQWHDLPRGGHFPAIEEPMMLVDDIREFARRLW